MEFGKYKGQITAVAPYLIMALISVIFLFQVTMPLTNTFLASNATAGGQAGISNITGYTSANSVAQQFPILIILIVFVTLVAGMLKFLGQL